MENYQSFSIRVCFISLALAIFTLDSAKAENKTEPRRNPNLSPIWGWRSAYECILLASNHCAKEGYKLTMSGILDVNKSDVADFCQGGCAQHTRDVLKCIHEVKRDFWFANQATVHVLYSAIDTGCSPNSAGLSTVGYRHSSAGKGSLSFLSSLIASLILLFVLHI